jgi:hypothetical protein
LNQSSNKISTDLVGKYVYSDAEWFEINADGTFTVSYATGEGTQTEVKLM